MTVKQLRQAILETGEIFGRIVWAVIIGILVLGCFLAMVAGSFFLSATIARGDSHVECIQSQERGRDSEPCVRDIVGFTVDQARRYFRMETARKRFGCQPPITSLRQSPPVAAEDQSQQRIRSYPEIRNGSIVWVELPR